MVKNLYVRLAGGEDHSKPPILLPPGKLSYSRNFEASALGYTRIAGYERFDGQQAPSATPYYTLKFNSGVSQPNVGDTLTNGSVSAKILAIDLESGTWGVDAAGTFALNGGGFLANDTLMVGATTVATAAADSKQYGAATSDKDLTWRALAADDQRANIGPVPGSGPVRGVWLYNGDVYAFRDDAAGTTCLMYKATSTGWQQVTLPVTLQPGGRFRFVNYAFGGASSKYKMYGVDGVNKAFEFDGTTFTQITTGMAVDTPLDLAIHKNHLWLAFPGGSLQYSAVGDPLSWTPILGAGELAFGNEIAGLVSAIQDTLFVLTEEAVWYLQGAPGVDLVQRQLSDVLGARRFTLAAFPDPIFLSGAGLTTFRATQAYGNFIASTVSYNVNDIIEAFQDTALDVYAVISRKKNQYRLIRSDGYGLIAYYIPGSREVFYTRVSYEKSFYGFWSIQESNVERIFAGGDDGYVYEFDRGTSFDGANITAFITTMFNLDRSPGMNKRFIRVDFDVNTQTAITDMQFAVDFSYGGEDSPVSKGFDLSASSPSLWNTMVWDTGSWSTTANRGSMIAYVDGVGPGLAITLSSQSNRLPPFSIIGSHIRYEPLRRPVR